MFDRFRQRGRPSDDWAEIDRRSGVAEVEAAWVAAHLGEIRLVDIREPYELLERRVDGAEPVPMRELLMTAARFDPAAPLVLLCRSGHRSAVAAAHLERQGFRRVASLRGGILAWAEAGLPTLGR